MEFINSYKRLEKLGNDPAFPTTFEYKDYYHYIEFELDETIYSFGIRYFRFFAFSFSASQVEKCCSVLMSQSDFRVMERKYFEHRNSIK